MRSKLPDGLYMVAWRDVEGSFKVVGGLVSDCAPVLQRRFPYFESIAEPVGKCGPCAKLGVDSNMIAVTGFDSTPVCRFHTYQSWDQRP